MPPATSTVPRSPATEGPASGKVSAVTDPTISMAGAGRDFGNGAGVFDLHLEVDAGTILGVVGPSGAGKTTAIRLITGALASDAGQVRVMGEDPRWFRRSTRERIGYMPQLFSLYPDLTTDENVDFVASLFGLLVPRRRRRVREVLELVQLWDVRSRRAGRLSGGMQRRLELATALVHEPALLVLDEPTAGLDPLLRRAVWEELHRLKAAGRTIVVTTQYVTEAEGCDRVALVASGHLVALDSPNELRRTAAGGDLVEGAVEAPFDPAPLADQPGVRRVTSTGLRTFRLVVDDAGTIIPALDDLVADAGSRLVAAREVHLTFDEVFAELVDRPPAPGGAMPDEGAS